MIPEILFWLSVAAIFHSYLFFPWLVNFLSKGKKENPVIYKPEDDLPFVSILVSAHNEDEVIINKIRSIYHTLYPFDKFELLIGSDASTDGTNLICKTYSENYESLYFFLFKVRQGKPAIINNLVEHAKGDILILTDANVFFEIDTIFELIKQILSMKKSA
jgi:glycosyltransferase involved in cell wall biosynthesis